MNKKSVTNQFKTPYYSNKVATNTNPVKDPAESAAALFSLAGVDSVGHEGAFAAGAPSGVTDVGGAGGEATVEVGEPTGGEVGAAVGVTEGGGVLARDVVGAAVLGGCDIGGVAGRGGIVGDGPGA